MTLKNNLLETNSQRGETLTSVLLVLMLMSITIMLFQRWETNQANRGKIIYQQRQMLQIAKNQKVRQRLGLPCEQSATPNGITFSIQCTNSEIILRGNMTTLIFR